MTNARSLLLEEFTSRRTRNSAYSLRAFSRDLGIGVTSLSDFLAEKRNLSRSSLKKIVESLRLSPLQGEELVGGRANRPEPAEDLRRHIEEDTFRLIADCYYLAVLNLAKIKSNRAQPGWIARRLGIKETDAKQALVRLERLGLIQIKDGRLIRTAQTLSTTRDVPSSAIKRHHSQNLVLAERSLMNDPVELREFSSATIVVDPRKLPRAKNLLMSAKRRVAKVLEEGEPSEVYVLSFQLFPLTKKENA
ncbi:MAG: DUF4423 domain-containing protein [Bdellovibrionia bacterium]